MTEAEKTIDIAGCEAEPIHQLGRIQPIGFLVAVSDDWTIRRLSDNLDRFAARAPDSLLGQPLHELFTRDAIHMLRNLVVQLNGGDAVERVFSLSLLLDDPEKCFDCAIHRAGTAIVIEAEPSDPISPTESAGLIRSMVARLDVADDLERFLRQGARQMHGLTGFDRVMIYRFHLDGSGEVVAEVARSGIEPLLGLRYPASDIPPQARALYLRTPFRIICDIDAQPAAIVPALDAAGEPLDLSLSILRAVSPIHIQYLRNMGVVASLSVSIIVEGRLWGLFACHHYAPRCPPFDLRTLTELFVQMFSMRLESRERREAAAILADARATGDGLMTAIAEDIGLLNDPDWMMRTIGALLPCNGVAITLRERTACCGTVPAEATLTRIVDHLRTAADGGVFATDHLSEVTPGAMDGEAVVAGMLAIPISADPGDYVMLFRRPRAQSVTWAGNPHKALTGDTIGTLSPRASFAAWREEVHDRAEPFTAAELAMAETLRSSLVEVVLRLASAAVAERQHAGLRQEVLIAELNHRVRNILALIGGLVRQSNDPTIGVAAYIELLEGRIQALARAHDQITQDNWAPASLRQLFEVEGAQYVGIGRLMLAGDPILLEPLAFSTLTLVVHELMTNAVKHGALSGRGRIDVDWRFDDAGDLVVAWRECDGPPAAASRRQGLGTVIMEQSIPHDLKGQATIDHDPAGLRARFVIPARHVRAAPSIGAEAAPAHHPSIADAPPPAPLPIDGPVLLVEDSLLIAIHLEDIMRQIGVTQSVTAATVADALAEIDRQPPVVAVLDFNLGHENSLPIAERLRRAGIPHVFATGYGDQLSPPPGHETTPIIQKPYTKANIEAAMRAIMR